MTRAAHVTAALLAVVAALGTSCASDERPEVVPGSTIATSSTTTSSPTGTTVDDEPSDLDRGTTTPTSTPRLDPNDPDYPTTVPPQPQPTVSYPVTG